MYSQTFRQPGRQIDRTDILTVRQTFGQTDAHTRPQTQTNAHIHRHKVRQEDARNDRQNGG